MLGRLLTLETLNLAWNPILEITGTLMYREKKIVVVLGNPICLTSQKKKKKKQSDTLQCLMRTVFAHNDFCVKTSH